MDCSLPGSSVHGILQARILEWVAISIELKRVDSNHHHQGLLQLTDFCFLSFLEGSWADRSPLHEAASQGRLLALRTLLSQVKYNI